MAVERIWGAIVTEEFTPSELVEQAQACQNAGFDGLAMSDHFAPWWPDGRGSQAWVTLGAVGQVTRLPLATGVTPISHHYHPGLVAQAFMSLEELYPGRIVLGVGSGESLNETPLGADWPGVGEQQRRLATGLEAINRLFAGETVTMDAGWFQLKEARLYTRALGRPRIIVSAFGPQAAEIAAEHGDGLWTLADPEQAPEIVEAYRDACGRHGREPGRVFLQSGASWADDEQRLMDGVRHWKPTQLDELYVEDIWDPAEMQRMAAERMSDEEFKQEFVISTDPEEHAERIAEQLELPGTDLVVQIIGGADPLGTIRLYGDHVLPAVRDGEPAGRRFGREPAARPRP